jgi:hypothetical protein
MKVFKLVRGKDVSGVSGVGHVLDGVTFDDGTTIIWWKGEVIGRRSSISVFKSYDDFLAIHVRPHPENDNLLVEKEVTP